MVVTLHRHLPLEIIVNIMRRLEIRDRKAHATVFQDLFLVFQNDIDVVLEKALEDFERRVLDSPVRVKAWSSDSSCFP